MPRPYSELCSRTAIRVVRARHVGFALLAAVCLGPGVPSCTLDATGSQAQLCTADSQCDDGDPCTGDHCGGSGVCDPGVPLDGILPTQTPGDCLVTQCVGGLAVNNPEDGDLPDDDNPCTSDSCANGAPVFDTGPKDGHGCVIDDQQGQCVNGACEPAQCTAENAPVLCDDDNPCTDDSCVLETGQCLHLPVSDQPASEQTPGDCHLVMCVGGALQDMVDDGDLPDDDLQCTRNLCNSGSPEFPPVTVGTVCSDGGGQVCDDAGACVACNQPADCIELAEDNECRTRLCDGSHACTMSYVGTGQALAVQYGGDCQRRECDGAGNVINVEDDGDLPVDGNSCTDDVCSGGAPSNPFLPPGTTCASGKVCNATGQCGCDNATECGTDTQCASWTCDSQICNHHFRGDGYAVPNGQTAHDCHQIQCDGAGNEQNRVDDTDVPLDDGIQCTSEACSNGVAQHPPQVINTQCSQNGGSYCDANGACVQCNSASQCTDPHQSCKQPSCPAQSCVQANVPLGQAPAWQQTANDCKIVNCDGSGNASTGNLDSDVPLDDGNQCTDEACSGGNPVHPAKQADTVCQSGGIVCNGSSSNPACVACYQNGECIIPPNTTCNGSTFTCFASGNGGCASRYGSLAGFIKVCSESPTECRLTVNFTASTCAALCSLGGKSCLGAYNDTWTGSCVNGSGSTCNATDLGSAICICSQ